MRAAYFICDVCEISACKIKRCLQVKRLRRQFRDAYILSYFLMETANKLTIETHVLVSQTCSFRTNVAIYFREIEARQKRYQQNKPESDLARIALNSNHKMLTVVQIRNSKLANRKIILKNCVSSYSLTKLYCIIKTM